MEELAFRSPDRKDLRWIFRSAPRPNEEIDLAKIALFAVWEPDLVVDNAVFVDEIVRDPANAEAITVPNIDASLRAQVGTANIG